MIWILLAEVIQASHSVNINVNVSVDLLASDAPFTKPGRRINALLLV
ncbi:MAG: hypothetical protein ACI9A2_000688, partial [Halioglobus sp.]